MKCFSILNIILLFSIFINNSNGAKILSIFGYPGPSQYIMASALLKGLVEQGHEITSISMFPQKEPIRNFRDITVMENSNLFEAIISSINEGESKGYFQEDRELGVASAKLVTNIMENPEVKKVLENEKFDLLIMEILFTEALFGLGEYLNVPIVAVSTLGTLSATDYVVGNTSPSSYIPHISLPFDNHMNLKERLWNVITTIRQELEDDYILMPSQEKLYKKYFPSATLTFDKARKNISLVLLNQHFALSFPRPYVPNMIEVGGLHIKQQPDPLPADLQQFLDNATEDVVYFSMGSNLKSKDFPAETLEVFLDTFRELHIKVLWKFEAETLPNKPDNVFIKSWYPQPSVLAHPRVKLFISHGGFLSTTETIFHAKPILGLPVFGDQPMNVQNAVRAGYALSLQLQDITKELFKAAIQELLTNQSYTKAVKKISKQYRDQHQTPLEKAIFWIEYVLRHEGAVHMRNAGQELNFWQYHNIDVIAILISGSIFGIFIIWSILYFIHKQFCGKKSNRKSNKTKRT